MPSPRPILFLLCLCGTALQAGHPEKRESRWVPDAWVARARLLKGTDGEDVGSVVDAFAKEHSNRVLEVASGEERDPYPNLSFADLDGDGRPEGILFIGFHGEANSQLYLMREEGTRWRILHQEYVWMHNEAPRFQVLSASNGPSVFMLTHLYERGSGIWLFSRRFYRMTPRGFAQVLETVETSNFSLGTELVNGHADSKEIGVDGNDLLMTFAYEFEAGYLLQKDIGLGDEDAYKQMSLLKGEALARYRWDPRSNAYRIVPAALNAAKTRCFSVYGMTVRLAGPIARIF